MAVERQPNQKRHIHKTRAHVNPWTFNVAQAAGKKSGMLQMMKGASRTGTLLALAIGTASFSVADLCISPQLAYAVGVNGRAPHGAGRNHFKIAVVKQPNQKRHIHKTPAHVNPWTFNVTQAAGGESGMLQG